MTVRPVKISPDRTAVAIRSDAPIDAWNAWGVMSALHGGHWSTDQDIQNWVPLDVPAE